MAKWPGQIAETHSLTVTHCYEESRVWWSSRLAECVGMWGAWERWEWRKVRWHLNSSAGSLAVFLGCMLLPLLRSAAPPQLLLLGCSSLAALCSLRCCPVTSRLHLSQLTAAVDTSLSPYWGSISSLIQPCWESLLQDAGVRRPTHLLSSAEKETWSRANTLLGSFRCDANLDVTESGILQGNTFTFPDLSCDGKKKSNNLNSKTILLVLSRAAEVRKGDLFCTLRNCFHFYSCTLSQSAVILKQTGAISADFAWWVDLIRTSHTSQFTCDGTALRITEDETSNLKELVYQCKDNIHFHTRVPFFFP